MTREPVNMTAEEQRLLAYSRRKPWRLTIAAAAAIVGIGTGLALSATPAHADASLDFVQALEGSGVNVYDAPMAIGTGKWICGRLNYENGWQAAQELYHATNNDIPDMIAASKWVVAAGTTLCPWQYHPGQVA